MRHRRIGRSKGAGLGALREMKILIDECVPAGLKAQLTSLGHECKTVQEAGYGSKKNGELLMLAEAHWDVLLTSDRKIRYQ